MEKLPRKQPTAKSANNGNWIDFVKEVAKKHNLSYKDAMKKASELRKKK